MKGTSTAEAGAKRGAEARGPSNDGAMTIPEVGR